MSIYRAVKRPKPEGGLPGRLARLEDERFYAERRRDWKRAEELTEEIIDLRARIQIALRPNSEARRRG